MRWRAGIKFRRRLPNGGHARFFALPVGHPQRFRRPGVRGAAPGAGPDRRHQLRPPEGHAGRRGRRSRTATSRRTCPTSTAPTWRSTTTCSETVRNRPHEQPHHRSRRAVGGARRLRLLRRPAGLPARIGGDDGGGRQGRQRRSSRLDEIIDAERLGAAQLPDGRAHRPRPLPQLPHLELRPDDGADRRLPRPQHRRVLALPDVAERVDLYQEQQRASRSSSSAARPSTATSPSSTCATRRRSTPATGS